MKATQILHQKIVLNHEDGKRQAIFEIRAWQVRKTTHYPEGVKYSAWLSEDGKTIFGFDNHSPKGPHLHVGEQEVGYVYRGLDALREDVRAMIRKEGFIYEDE